MRQRRRELTAPHEARRLADTWRKLSRRDLVPVHSSDRILLEVDACLVDPAQRETRGIGARRRANLTSPSRVMPRDADRHMLNARITHRGHAKGTAEASVYRAELGSRRSRYRAGELPCYA